jgi:polyisoprenyl-phosphate glycosyltransferase
MTANKIPVVGVILPCYNEEEVLQDSFTKLNILVNDLIDSNKINNKSFIAFVDDGSKDKTWQLIETIKNSSRLIKGLKLANNSGHQSAILAGMLTFKDECDCIITIDADLQDDINAMEKMITDFINGIDIVYGIRKGRPTDSFFKKNTALGFYKLMKTLGVNIKHNHADYRLVSRRVVEELSKYKEVNIFLRGIFPIIGFSHSEVHYDRKERLAGETKYP